MSTLRGPKSRKFTGIEEAFMTTLQKIRNDSCAISLEMLKIFWKIYSTTIIKRVVSLFTLGSPPPPHPKKNSGKITFKKSCILRSSYFCRQRNGKSAQKTRINTIHYKRTTNMDHYYWFDYLILILNYSHSNSFLNIFLNFHYILSFFLDLSCIIL